MTTTCIDCKETFTPSDKLLALYDQRGWHKPPARCPDCYAAQRPEPRKERHLATCAECARETYVPFKPVGTKPVLCRDCYRASHPRTAQ